MGLRDRVRDLGLRALDRLLPPPIEQVFPAPELRKADNPPTGVLPELGADEDPKAIFADPYMLMEQLGFREKPFGTTYQTLRMMTWRMPIISAFLQRRLAQVSAFSSPQADQFSMGFKIDLRGQNRSPSRAAKRKMEQLERFILCTGFSKNEDERPSFDSFLQKSTWDSLVFDQLCTEIVPSRKGKPAEFYAADASTMRLAETARLHPDEDDTETPRVVQVWDGVVIETFTSSEMTFEVRNPRSDVRVWDYGTPELEMLIETVTALLWGWDYNKNMFKQGTLQKGLLNMKGQVNPTQLKAFRRMWYQLLAGAENAFRLPILNTPDGIEWINMSASSKDMEFAAWFDFLMKIFCAVYGMHRSEIGFEYGAGQEERPMFESSNKYRITESKDTGLKPILRFHANWINRKLIHPLDEDFEFKIVGLNASTPEEHYKLVNQQVTTIKTVDEVRKDDGLEPMEDGLGNVVLNAVWLQNKAAMEQQKQQAEMAQQGGQPGQGNGAPSGFDGDDGEPRGPENGEPDQDEDEAPDESQILGALSDFGGQGAEKSLSPSRGRKSLIRLSV